MSAQTWIVCRPERRLSAGRIFLLERYFILLIVKEDADDVDGEEDEESGKENVEECPFCLLSNSVDVEDDVEDVEVDNEIVGRI